MKHKMNRVYIHLIITILMVLGLIFYLTPLAVAQSSIPTISTGSTIYYVYANGDGTGGLTWDTAFNDIWDAISAANYGDEIWVAAGRYTPGNAVNVSFK
jgi:hypothetical protein